MPLLGSAALLLTFDIVADAVEEHDRWHTREHLPERLALPGFLRGTRWSGVAGGPRYMVLYEVRELGALASEDYLARLDDPTPWTRRVMPSYRGMSRGLCSVLGSVGPGLGSAAALLRIGVGAAREAELRHRLLEDVLPRLADTSGIASAHLLRGAQQATMTNEQRIRGADGGIDAALVVTGHDAGAIAASARALCADDGLPLQGGRDVECALFDTNLSLSREELGAGVAATPGARGAGSDPPTPRCG